MTLNPIKANMTEVELNGTRILFSYRTPVAALVCEERLEGIGWYQYRTTKKWGNTTTRHINIWNPLGRAYELKPQEFFDSLITKVK